MKKYILFGLVFILLSSSVIGADLDYTTGTPTATNCPVNVAFDISNLNDGGYNVNGADAVYSNTCTSGGYYQLTFSKDYYVSRINISYIDCPGSSCDVKIWLNTTLLATYNSVSSNFNYINSSINLWGSYVRIEYDTFDGSDRQATTVELEVYGDDVGPEAPPAEENVSYLNTINVSLSPAIAYTNDTLLGYCEGNSSSYFWYNVKMYKDGSLLYSRDDGDIVVDPIADSIDDYWSPSRWNVTNNWTQCNDGDFTTPCNPNSQLPAQTQFNWTIPDRSNSFTCKIAIKYGAEAVTNYTIPDACYLNKTSNKDILEVWLSGIFEPDPGYIDINFDCDKGVDDYERIFQDDYLGVNGVYDMKVYWVYDFTATNNTLTNVYNLSSTETTKGDTFIFSCQAENATGTASWVNSSSLTILNSIPYFSYLSPPNDYHNNKTLNVTFVVNDIDLDLLNCSLYVDNVLNNTVYNIVSGTNNSISSKAIINESVYSWYLNCTDGTSYSSTPRTYTYDTTSPTWTLKSGYNLVDQYLAYGTTFYQSIVMVNDSYLYGWNATCKYTNGTILYQNVTTGLLNTTNKTIDINFNFTNPNSGYDKNITCIMDIADWHTAKDYKADKIEKKNENEIRVDDVRILLKDGYSDYLSYIESDYSISFTFNMPEEDKVKIKTYEVYCDADNFDYNPYSEFPAHFVCGDQWIDFVNKGEFAVDVKYYEAKNDKPEYYEVKTKGYNFKSIGGLNHNITEWSFGVFQTRVNLLYYNNFTLTYISNYTSILTSIDNSSLYSTNYTRGTTSTTYGMWNTVYNLTILNQNEYSIVNVTNQTEINVTIIYTPNTGVVITILNELTGLPINENFTAVLTSDLYEETFTIEDAYGFTLDFPSDVYKLTVSNDNYPARVYWFNAINDSLIYQTVYMLNESEGETITFYFKDQFGDVVRNVYVNMTRFVNGSRETITNDYSDFAGIVEMFLDQSAGYQITVTHADYETISEGIQPSKTSYIIYLYTDFVYDINTSARYVSKTIRPDSNVLNVSVGVQHFNMTTVSSSNSIEWYAVYYNSTVYDNDTTSSGGTVDISLDLSQFENETITILYYIMIEDYGLVTYSRNYYPVSYEVGIYSITANLDYFKDKFTPLQRVIIALVVTGGIMFAISVLLSSNTLSLIGVLTLIPFAQYGWIDKVSVTIGVIMIVGYVIIRERRGG